jgi:calcium-dependent protein kinase
MGACATTKTDENGQKHVYINQMEMKEQFIDSNIQNKENKGPRNRMIKFSDDLMSSKIENENNAFQRKQSNKRKTVGVSNYKIKELNEKIAGIVIKNVKDDELENIKNEKEKESETENEIKDSLDNIEKTTIEPNKKFQRRENRSISLIEKKKMGSQIFKDELKLRVQLNTLIEENKCLPTKKYKVINKLGDGAYGTVYLANNLMTKQKVAMKKIDKVKDNEIDDMEIKNEIDILRKLDHPNIVKIIEFYSASKAYYIITDYCPCGELYNQIKTQYNEYQLSVLFYQVFSGLCYLHSKNIVHRDLKLENILISEMEPDKKTNRKYFWIKIIDFGTAKIFEKNKNEKTVVGSSYYIAPEVLQKNYNEKCDTWSAGVILYMLIVGRAPFDGKNDDEIIDNIKKGKFNAKHKKLLNASSEVQDLVKHLLQVNVKKRFSASDALKHPWFKKFNAKAIYFNIDKDQIIIYLNRLRKFQINSKFQQMVLAFITHNIPDSKETKDILKIFRMFDTDDDGKLTMNELFNGLINYFDENIIKNEINDIFLLLDGGNRGYIEYEEFLRATVDQKTLLSEENLVYAFNFFDKGNKGKLSVDKIKKFFVDDKVSEDVFKSIFNEIDSNEDGEIDFGEFKDMMYGF